MQNRIAELRESKGLSQRQLGELANTTGVQIGYLERGARRLTIDWMRRIADALGCDPADLLPGSQAMPTDAGRGRPAPLDEVLMRAAIVGTLSALADARIVLPPEDVARIVLAAYRTYAAPGRAPDSLPDAIAAIIASVTGE